MSDVRRATPADAAALAEIRVASWRSTYRGLVSDEVLDGLDLATETQRFATWIGIEPDRWQLVAVDAGGSVVGYCMFGADRDHEGQQVGEIYAIYVHPAAQGSGHGTRLISAAVTVLREAGYGALHVWALFGNQTAESFYQRRGWERDGQQRDLETLPAPDGRPVRESRFTLPADRTR